MQLKSHGKAYNINSLKYSADNVMIVCRTQILIKSYVQDHFLPVSIASHGKLGNPQWRKNIQFPGQRMDYFRK